jgi:hypothetical protein
MQELLSLVVVDQIVTRAMTGVVKDVNPRMFRVGLLHPETIEAHENALV